MSVMSVQAAETKLSTWHLYKTYLHRFVSPQAAVDIVISSLLLATREADSWNKVIEQLVFPTEGVKHWQQNSVYVQNRMLQPLAAFPSIGALKEGEFRHLDARVLAYTSTHPNTYNTNFFKDPELDSECAMLAYTENLPKKTALALTYPSFSFPVGLPVYFI